MINIRTGEVKTTQKDFFEDYKMTYGFEPLKIQTEYTKEEIASMEELERKREEKRIEKESRMVIFKYRCTVCGSITEDEDGLIIDPEETAEFKEIKCEKCQKEEQIQKRFYDFIKDVPIIFRDNLNFNQNKKLLTERNSILYGAYGVGKTTTAYSIAKELWMDQKIKSFKVVREIQILNDLRSDISDYEYKNADLLVIDEFGKVNNTDFTKAQVFNIIDYRNDWDKKTILICNASTTEELSKIIPVAIQDRFKKCVIKLEGKTKR